MAHAYPATDIPLTYYENTSNTALSNAYYKLSGTSMAVGVVSGALALLLQQQSSLTPDQVKARLMQTAYKNLQQYSTAVDLASGTVYHEQADVFTVGAGYLDIQAALSTTALASLPAVSPTANYDSSCDCVYFLESSSAVVRQFGTMGLVSSLGERLVHRRSVRSMGQFGIVG